MSQSANPSHSTGVRQSCSTNIDVKFAASAIDSPDVRSVVQFDQFVAFSNALIVGTGLLGTSLGLALTSQNVPVYLRDISPTALCLARDMGAGMPWEEMRLDADQIQLVVIAAPPDVAGGLVVNALHEFPNALVTDVASVKDAVHIYVNEHADVTEASRYVGSHPMAGRERSGAAFARADLFAGAPWVIVARKDTPADVVHRLQALAVSIGAVPLEMAPEEHDAAVALVSHVPQLVSSLLGARLADAPVRALGLAGGGLRDTTRIAASDPKLWAAIIGANTKPIAKVLREYQADLASLINALEYATSPSSPGLVGEVTRAMHQGNRGVSRIPGKHGGAPRRYEEILVVIPDKPGELARLFNDVGILGINIEDLNLEHSPGGAVGVAQLLVDPSVATPLTNALREKGWGIASI